MNINGCNKETKLKITNDIITLLTFSKTNNTFKEANEILQNNRQCFNEDENTLRHSLMNKTKYKLIIIKQELMNLQTFNNDFE